jgi:hypothetical protein
VACIGLLVFAYIGRDVRDTDIIVVIALLILCFPVSLALAALLTGVFYLLHAWAGVVVPGGFGFNALAWLVFMTTGYLQWMAMVPQLFTREPNVI